MEPFRTTAHLALLQTHALQQLFYALRIELMEISEGATKHPSICIDNLNTRVNFLTTKLLQLASEVPNDTTE